MTLDDLPSVRDALTQAGLSADKRFGQHFLLDLNICRKIVRLSAIHEGETVIEIGPGPGGLTRALLDGGATVIAIEKDRRFLPLLGAMADASCGRLNIVNADALHVDEDALAGAMASIVANLPYNVGTPLLIKWLTGSFRPRTMTLMFQKEVARRLVAAPGSDDYGRLSVLAQALCKTAIVMELPPRAFSPPPKVDSAVVQLLPRAHRPTDRHVSALQRVTHDAFGQRRKMLRSSLRGLGGESLCRSVGVDPFSRAETVSVDAFLDLAAAVASA